MFSNQGIQPVSVVFSNTKHCFLQLPSKLATHLSLNEVTQLAVLVHINFCDCDYGNYFFYME